MLGPYMTLPCLLEVQRFQNMFLIHFEAVVTKEVACFCMLQLPDMVRRKQMSHTRQMSRCRKAQTCRTAQLDVERHDASRRMI